jgi:preprotein translocase subunit SecG
MNLAAIDWLSISIDLLLVVFVIVCLLMMLLILMQRPKQEGLGAAFGAGVTDQVFGARTTNVLQRGTVYLGSLFFLLSLVLAVLIGHKNKKTSLLTPPSPAAKVEVAQPTEPAPPKSLSEELPVDVSPAEPAVTPPVSPTPPPATEPAPATAPVPAPASETATPPPAAPAPAAPKSEEKSAQP